MQGSKLKALRKEHGLKQHQLADILGLSAAYIGELEREEKTIDARLAKRIGDLVFTGIDISYSDALGGWTVTVSAPIPAGDGPPGRRHAVVAKHDTEDEAVAHARRLMATTEPFASLKVHRRWTEPSVTDLGGRDSSAR